MTRARKPPNGAGVPDPDSADDTRPQEVVSFKADPELTRFLRRIPNRSEFIRTTLMAAFGHICPLCQGRGVLEQEEAERWRKLMLEANTPREVAASQRTPTRRSRTT